MILRLQQGLDPSQGQCGQAVPMVRHAPTHGVLQQPQGTRTFGQANQKAMIEANPSFGYRDGLHLLGFNNNTVQRDFQLKGWVVR